MRVNFPAAVARLFMHSPQAPWPTPKVTVCLALFRRLYTVIVVLSLSLSLLYWLHFSSSGGYTYRGCACVGRTSAAWRVTRHYSFAISFARVAFPHISVLLSIKSLKRPRGASGVAYQHNSFAHFPLLSFSPSLMVTFSLSHVRERLSNPYNCRCSCLPAPLPCLRYTGGGNPTG